VGFLKAYVKDSVQEFPVLGPEETELRRTVTSAHSLLNVWRSLIAQADATVLLKKRKEDPANKHIWRLKFMDHTNRHGQGPVYEVSKVSQHVAISAPLTSLAVSGISHLTLFLYLSKDSLSSALHVTTITDQS
jgi:hypothetical protein